ncbi:hypothetical protein P43SY_010685 [Pythium insidiosum]|uniref:Uncharacterized protein n=1 Tax=Pythium insidiosum TaxID=114742 RepID=A0AAD5Q4B8_PYTIN|nr:hypothetical protein P43SY_010685 [Pythium insidiosum]
MTMASCIEAIIASARRNWKAYKHRKNKVGQNSNASYDEEMSNVLLVSTHFVAKQIESEYAMANAKYELYVYEKKGDDVVLVHHGGRARDVV